jgi:predicted heme/steroid binding protein/uncharacterized membrane protein
MKEFDLEELQQYDGKDGRPAYVVHQGRIIDVSQSALWKGGLHMRRHQAGNDLTTDIQAAPHGLEVLERYPQVGIVKKEKAMERKIPGALAWLLKTVPMLRRHPHPMTVHFPIVFMLSTSMFTILFLITGIKAFEITAFHCLGGGLLFTPVAIMTGLYTWWLNYMARPMKATTIKKWLSTCLFLLQIIAFLWRLKVPGILDAYSIGGLVYFLIILLFTPMVSVIGWYGASMTFPVEKD